MAPQDAAKRWVVFDWGGTLMSEDGPLDLPMALWPDVSAIEGAHETLATLARRYGIAVATNASISRRNMIEIALGRVGLRDWIAEVFCYADIGARKDSDEFWRAVLERLGADPADLVMVGDSPDQDVIAPGRFGIHAILYDPRGEHAEAGAYPVIRELPQAIALIDAWFARP